MIYDSILETIGNTPVVRLNKIAPEGVTIYVKIESFNPIVSVKDRLAFAIIDDALNSGELKPGQTVVEATSGNTGIALAMVAAVKGYQCILTMPESMSPERRVVLRAFGAKLVLTDPAKGMPGAIDRANALCGEIKNACMPQQFRNAANPEVHRKTTAVEIWEDTDGQVDALIAGVGTGGTITGVAQVLKERKPSFKAIAVEPEDSPILSGGSPGPHKIQGIGPGFVPDVLETENLDGVITVSNDASVDMALRLAREEGILCGISSGANVVAAIEYGSRPENAGKTIVTVICDFGERYIQTVLFENLRYEGSDAIGS